MLWYLVFVFILGLVDEVFGWKHVASEDFQKVVERNDLTLVAFVAPWTEDSKALESEWKSASSRTQHQLVSVDCTIETRLCGEHEIISYPAIRLFKKNKSVGRYRGKRVGDAIVQFIKRSTLPQVSILERKNITAFKTSEEAVIVAYADPSDTDLKGSFRELATRYHDKFSFGLADASLGGIDNVPPRCIVCYRKEEEMRKVLCGEAKVEVLEKFVESATTPLIGEVTRRNELKYLKAGKSLIYIFALTEKERKAYRVSLRSLAKKYEEYISFVTVDAVEYAHMAPGLGLKAGIFPALALQNPMVGQVFPFDQRRPINAESVDGFVMDIVQGRTPPSGNEGKKITHTDL